MSERILSHLVVLAKGSGQEETGVLIGKSCGVQIVFPNENLSHSPTEFLANPLDVVAGHNLAEALGLEVEALYHTHPFGAPKPSKKDLEGMALWPIPWLIASPIGVRAWALSSGSLSEVPLVVVA
ncbi:MAG: Mov34/MPN/PAD-1 family protein [Acidilobus sp.]